LRLLFGPKFLQAVFSFQVLMLAALFLFLNNTCGIALTAVGQQRWAPRITIAGLGLNVILNLLLIPRLDYLGSSYATLATEIFVLVFAYLALRPHWRRVTTPVLKLTRAADPE
ncbi:MAG: polysaccharide biosynthesis C-terminal domain-containing protein, partial [Terriglobia bacterium]